jgi:AraC family transcriptional regulator of adaptative response/methylated-DNA-[protein]-cysteine methyltransferase
MNHAFQTRDSQFDGVFFTAVRTTGIFCRPSCPARKPKAEHVEYFASAREALFAGYRPCKRCSPMIPPGARPGWVDELFARLDEAPDRRWTDRDLADLGLEPLRVRRWFLAQYAMTFHAYQRATRLGTALGQMRQGADITETAFDAGFESLSGFRDAFQRLFGAPPGRSRSQGLLVVNRVLTPLGPMLAGVADDALILLEFCDRRMLESQIRRLQARLRCHAVPGDHPLISEVADQLLLYFTGRLREFSVAVATPGTEFQRKVWDGLQQIPYGQTTTYAEQAARLGCPDAVRAVARANGDNRIAIVIPCHRVIGAHGEMCGYGGGIWRKRYLLDLEKSHS